MNRWNTYTTNEIKPAGWIKKQLEIQSKGQNGNLDKMWPDVKDSGWIGGNAENWERVPCWLDGFVPLSYLLEDADMIARAKKYVDTIIANQQPDGWICPCTEEERDEYESWPILLITKVLVLYHSCTGDERIPKVVYGVLKNFYQRVKDGKVKFVRWTRSRWYESFFGIQFLLERYDEPWITELAKLLRENGTIYIDVMDRWEHPLNYSTHVTHSVNIAQAFKYEAVSCDILGLPYEDAAEKMYQKLQKFHGTPVGSYTGDECLAGRSPIQGTELCAIVDMMFSFEVLYAYTGDKKWAERLEMLAFNALPATISDDMWTHQYDQLSNQIACRRFPGKPIFRTNSAEANMFGLEPHFGCCTANHGQGWPKFTLSSFMHSGSEIINVLPIPTKLDCDKASIAVQTNYPFENSIRYTVNARENFTFKIRIPSFAENLVVNGEKTRAEELEFAFEAGQSGEIHVSFETTPHLVERPHGLTTVQCGSLVFAIPIQAEQKMFEYEKDGVERKFPYCDYELMPASPWNYAYSSDVFSVVRREIEEVPFSSVNPPVTVKAKVKKINWGLEEGYEEVCAKVPVSREPISEEEEITLYPYGCAKLRMTEIPFVG